MALFNIVLSCWGRWFLNFSSKSWMVSSIFWLCPLLPKESSKKLEPVLELRLPTHERKKNQKYINGPIFDHGPRSPRIDYFENNRQNLSSHLKLDIWENDQQLLENFGLLFWQIIDYFPLAACYFSKPQALDDNNQITGCYFP